MKTADELSPRYVLNGFSLRLQSEEQTPEQREALHGLLLLAEQLVSENEKLVSENAELKRKNRRNAGRKGPPPEQLKKLIEIKSNHAAVKNTALRVSNMHSAYNQYLNSIKKKPVTERTFKKHLDLVEDMLSADSPPTDDN